MPKKFYVSPMAFGLVIAATQVYAVVPMQLDKTPFLEVKNAFDLRLPSPALSSSSSPLPNSLQFLKQHEDEHQVTHIRMQQHYLGFPVYGGYAIFHTHVRGSQGVSVTQGIRMNGVVYSGLDAELGHPDPHFVPKAAKVLAAFEAPYQSGMITEETVIPMVYMDDQGHPFWAYKVSMLVSYNDKIPERPSAIIDAKTGATFVSWNALKTVRSLVQGIGFGGNHHTGRYQFGHHFPSLTMTRNAHTGMCTMENKAVKVIDLGHKYSGPMTAMRFPCVESDTLHSNTYWTGYQGDGYDQENGGFSVSNDALYAGQVIHQMYSEWYGLDVLTMDDQPMHLVMRVHFGSGYENAYWDGRQMTFGDGATMMYPLVSLGIAAHEISHGFTEQHANLEYFGQSGGINESFSDMAAQAAEYYSERKNSWSIGAEVMKEDSGYKALRFMDNPSRDGKSINSADQYRTGIDVHHSSGVYNRLFYVLSTMPDWDVKQAFHLMVKANMDYWTPNTTFKEAACGLMQAANDLGLSQDQVQQALEAVAIRNLACGNALPPVE